MNKQYRYPGAQPFRTSQKHIFFGREQDIRSFYQFLQLEKLVVLYSRSGLGKSSILNAGIIPMLLDKGEWGPIPVRFGSFSYVKEEGPLQEAIDSVKKEVPQVSFLERLLPDDHSLWAYLKKRQLAYPEQKGFILLFDQFEELFTYPAAEITAFKKGLAEALHTALPQRYLDLIEAQLSGGEAILSAQEMELLHQPFGLKVVLAIRSDRMHLLNELRDHLPGILSHNYELGPLSRQSAEDAIINPAYQKEGNFLSPPFDYQDEAIEKILAYLTKDNVQEIESFQLQLLCQSLERKAIREKISLIENRHISNLENLYENYYENQIKALDSPAERLAARRLIEEGLIFEEEERRLILYEGQIKKEFDVAPELLAKLVDSHLIRAEPSLRGGFVYELSHDTLVGPILRAKKKRLEEELRRAELQAQEKRERELIQERKRRRWATALAVIGFLLFGIALAASLIAIRQSKLAQAKEEEAKENLAHFLAAQQEKDRLRVRQLIQDAETYASADEYLLALDKLREALGIDSTNQDVQLKIEGYEKRLQE
ncbi:MAG: hypothetical protein H6564_11355 [Lewinellaceae bacterium]|nr:hypothetical protein [Lewinellaceae bacterium]